MIDCKGLHDKNEMESAYLNHEWWIYLHILSYQMLKLQKLKITQVLFWRNVFNSCWAVMERDTERERERESLITGGSPEWAF